MMNKIIKRALMGFMYGVFIGQTIVLLESLFAGDGNYYALTTWLVDHTKSKLAAAFIQYLITGLIGTTFAAGTVIFEVQNWSLAAKTTLHFVITAVVMYLAGFICGWFPHTVISTVLWFGLFVVIYVIFWICFYNFTKKKAARA